MSADVVSGSATEAVSPDHEVDQAMLAQVKQARSSGLLPLARQLLDQLSKRFPQSIEVKRQIISTCLVAEDFDRAIDLLEQLLYQSPEDYSSWLSLAWCFARSGNLIREREVLAKALSIKYEEMPARRMFELQRDAGDMDGALKTVRSLRSLRDTDELVIAEIRLLSLLGLKDEALAITIPWLDRKPLLKGAIEFWTSYHLVEKNDPQTVIGEIEARLASGREEAVFYACLSRARHRMDQSSAAIDCLKRALGMDPSNHQWWYELGIQQRQAGELSEAQASLHRSLDLAPLDPLVLRIFGAEHHFVYGDPHFNRVNHALALIDSLPKPRQVEMHYAAAKAFEDVGDLDTAFEHYRLAGRKQTEITPYREVAVNGLLKTVRLGMGPSSYQNAQTGCQSDLPVFVLGMPRSGTTLVEQIISSHPEAYGAGELKLLHRVVDGLAVNGVRIQTLADPGVVPTFVPGVDLNCTKLGFAERGERYVQALQAIINTAGRSNSRRVVDKMPGNYFWTGLVPIVLPNAKIVHTRRHPADVCISNYRIFFPDGMPWSYDLRNLGKCFRAYHEHMQYWESNLPAGVMLSVRYEDVVADLEGMARKIISHIGLEWNSACLHFYETERAVKTASLGQVRQPIYTSSIGRWRKYEKYLKPLIDEIGPLMEAYEAELTANEQALQHTG